MPRFLWALALLALLAPGCARRAEQSLPPLPPSGGFSSQNLPPDVKAKLPPPTAPQ